MLDGVSSPKHLIVCLDGTWCDGDNNPAPETNVSLLSRIIAPKTRDGLVQRVYYDAGVGTGRLFDRLLGGAFGKGVSANVLAAYRFLSQFYEPGDHIYVFGFSRGAFTARSLCGFLSASGLLTREMCNQTNLEFAWSYYRTAPKKRYPADRARLARIGHRPDVRVRFLGVFDTVGALGVPKGFMSRFGRSAIEFHDADVSSVVDHSCHALAIDEHRVEFEAAIWTEPRHRNFKSVEQAWFPGGHTDVGGGCKDTGLSDLPLEWMLSRLNDLCPEVKLRASDEWPRQLAPDYLGKLHEGRGWLFWRSRLRPLVRLIDGHGVGRTWRVRLPTLRPHARPIGEGVHWSALARWQATSDAPRRKRYQPRNLLAALESLQNDRTRVVAPDGRPFTLSDLHGQAGDPMLPARNDPPPARKRLNGAEAGTGHQPHHQAR